jgi:SAM-dependent methyltransferase
MGFTGMVGIEPSRAPVESARPDIRPLIWLGILDPAAWESERFALATCFQTIEHVSDPRRLVRDIHRLLKPGGALIMVCHNHRALSAQLLGRRSPIFDIEHLQLFSRRSLRALYEGSGFQRISVRTCFNTYPLHYWTKLMPLPMRLKQRCLRVLTGSALGRLPLALPAGNLVGVGFKG